MIEAVTFDFWNTTMWERPGSLREQRLQLFAADLRVAGVDAPPARVAELHDAAHRAYEDAWRSGRQFRAADAAVDVAAGFNVDGLADALSRSFSEAGRRADVKPCEGVAAVLDELRGAGARLGIICDIGLTPSPVVRELLDRHDLLRRFDHLAFSDELGWYKPASEIFEHTLRELGATDPGRCAHIGDRRRTDVAGAEGAGMRSVRYTAVFDDPAADLPSGDLVLDDLRELPAALRAAAS